MHVLGISGMPRRIPDYPAMYQILNTICSLGSLISLFGVILWFYIIYEALEIKKNVSNRNPWIFLPEEIRIARKLCRVGNHLNKVHTYKYNHARKPVTSAYGAIFVKTRKLKQTCTRLNCTYVTILSRIGIKTNTLE
jgi:heme/copper-type cytochrome/quinol oxidase subunit 1